jgi:hypothetical protein
MPRQESDREDLLLEATALVERVELTAADRVAPIVAGFRSDCSLSIFFGAEPVYQFNSAGELRRAYANDQLLKALQGRLVALRRERHGDEVQLLRHELDAAEQLSFLDEMSARLGKFACDIDTGFLRIAAQVPQHCDVLSRVRSWLGDHPNPSIAQRPNVS